MGPWKPQDLMCSALNVLAGHAGERAFREEGPDLRAHSGPNLSLACKPQRKTGWEGLRGFCGVSRVVRSRWAQDRCQELGNQARGHQFLALGRGAGGLSYETSTSTSPAVIGRLMGVVAARPAAPISTYASMLAGLLKTQRAHLLPVGCGARV